MPSRVEILDAAGHVVRVVAEANTGLTEWSPNGSMVAWISDAGVNVENTDGSRRRLVVPKSTTCTIECGSLTFAWAPNGQSLAVGGAGAQTDRLLVVSLPTGKSVDIAPVHRFTMYSVIGWSPDGRSIAYDRTSGLVGHASCCQSHLIVAKANGADPRSLFSFADAIHDGAQDASWSPNSRSIAFTTDGMDTRDPRFAVVTVRTGKVHSISAIRPYVGPRVVWSPDSSMIAVGRPVNDAVTLSATGGGIRSLGAPGVVVSWEKTGEIILLQGANGAEVAEARVGHQGGRTLFRIPDHLTTYSIDPG